MKNRCLVILLLMFLLDMLCIHKAYSAPCSSSDRGDIHRAASSTPGLNASQVDEIIDRLSAGESTNLAGMARRQPHFVGPALKNMADRLYPQKIISPDQIIGTGNPVNPSNMDRIRNMPERPMGDVYEVPGGYVTGLDGTHRAASRILDGLPVRVRPGGPSALDRLKNPNFRDHIDVDSGWRAGEFPPPGNGDTHQLPIPPRGGSGKSGQRCPPGMLMEAEEHGGFANSMAGHGFALGGPAIGMAAAGAIDRFGPKSAADSLRAHSEFLQDEMDIGSGVTTTYPDGTPIPWWRQMMGFINSAVGDWPPGM